MTTSYLELTPNLALVVHLELSWATQWGEKRKSEGWKGSLNGRGCLKCLPLRGELKRFAVFKGGSRRRGGLTNAPWLLRSSGDGKPAGKETLVVPLHRKPAKLGLFLGDLRFANLAAPSSRKNPQDFIRALTTIRAPVPVVREGPSSTKRGRCQVGLHATLYLISPHSLTKIRRPESSVSSVSLLASLRLTQWKIVTVVGSPIPALGMRVKHR